MSSKSRRNQQARAPRGAARSGNPARRHGTVPAAPPARRTLERFSAPVLIRLHAMPRWIVPVVLAAALFGGLVMPTSWAWLGALLLVLTAVFVGWLTSLSWPILTPAARAVRVVLVVALLGIAVYKAMGRF